MHRSSRRGTPKSEDYGNDMGSDWFGLLLTKSNGGTNSRPAELNVDNGGGRERKVGDGEQLEASRSKLTNLKQGTIHNYLTKSL